MHVFARPGVPGLAALVFALTACGGLEDGPAVQFGTVREGRIEEASFPPREGGRSAPSRAETRQAAAAAWSTRPDDEAAVALARAYFPEFAAAGDDGAPRNEARALRVTLPSGAADPVVLETRRLSFAVTRLDGGGEFRRERVAAFVRAGRFLAPAGRTRASSRGWVTDRLEDYDIVVAPAGVHRAEYRLSLPDGIRGIRDAGEYLEFFDGEAGPPVLRLHLPEVRDREGTVRTGRVRLRGVAGGGDRPGVWIAGSGEVRIEVEVGLDGLAGPAVVDPGFSATGSLAVGRMDHTATPLPDGRVLVVGGSGSSLLLASAELYDPATGSWSATGSLAVGRSEHTATPLPDGKVLVVGGNGSSGHLASAELYDPATGTWTATGSLAVGRYRHTATPLPDGKVLVVGGIGSSDFIASAELYDPAAGSWTATGSLAVGRRYHTATPLPDGKVLVAGGEGQFPFYLASAEVYDPATESWTATGSMAAERYVHTATPLADGKVLVVGGIGYSSTPATAEVYDPATGRWATAGRLAVGRYYHTATPLPDGKVLVVGGIRSSSGSASAEVYDPATGNWTATGSLTVGRFDHTATPLPGGKVLVVGGFGPPAGLTSTELYDPAIGSWTATGSLAVRRSGHTATLLPDGRVLVVGGSRSSDSLASAELYDPASGSWTATGSLAVGRSDHTATPLPDGKVLVVGGLGASGVLASAELYDPATGSWTATASMAAGRYRHTATPLPDGRVLVVGGTASSAYLASAELYDPATDSWKATGSLAVGRHRHTATPLPDGTVLVAGGVGPSSATLASAELYDPATGSWRATASMAVGRRYHTATPLPDGKVLVVGGSGSSGVLASAELYDPATGSWMATGSLAGQRYEHRATPLPDGDVIVIGGTPATGAAERYDPGSGTWRPALSLLRPRSSGHSATLLSNGYVLVAGGYDGSDLDFSELLYLGPTALDRGVKTDEDVPVAITLAAEGDATSFRVVTPPAHGTLLGTAPALTYAPAPDFHGLDSFTFVASIGTAVSPEATVTITVVPVNDAPEAVASDLETDEDVEVEVTLAGSDVDGDPLEFRVVTPPLHGTLRGTPPTLVYAPEPDFHGTDRFEFVAHDGTVDSAPATVSISVAAVNDAPLALGGEFTTEEDTPAAVTLAGTDVDGDPLVYRVVVQPAHGTLSGTPPALTYTPAPDYHGPDTFTFVANDGTVDSAPATTSIVVNAVNDPPVAVAQSIGTVEDTPAAVTLVGTDVDGDTLVYRVVTPPEHGTLTGTPPALTYMPAADYHGPDAFAFVANDGTVDSAPATVAIVVTGANDPPVAAAQSITTVEDTPVAVTLAGTDVDGDALVYRVVGQPEHGSLTGTPPALTYTPAADYHGPDTFTFVANDGTVDSAPATVSISIAPVNDPPVAAGQTITTPEDTPVAVTLAGTDVEGDTLVYRVVTQPEHGTLAGTPPALTYTPAADYHGPDAFAFVANDGVADSAPAMVAISVTPVNDAPVATSLDLATDEDVAVALTLAARDVDGDDLAFRIENPPAHGTLSGTAPELVYRPEANYHGTDSFTFLANDGTEDSAPATVTITISPVDDAPVLDAATPSGRRVVSEGETVAFVVAATDADGDTLTLDVTPVPPGASFDPVSGAFSWTPAWFDAGEHVLLLSAGDGRLSDIRELTIVVTALDGDGDGLPDTWETEVGLDPETDDADGDTILDRDEVGEDLDDPRDTDGDGTIDALDDDSDDDGIPDAVEAGDGDPETPPVDTDGDGIPDYRDTDSDDDGVLDAEDLCRLVADADQADLDGDGAGDACDDDDDGDGIPDIDEIELGLDPGAVDSDGDGIADAEELGDPADPRDTDGDGVIDALDDDSDDDGVPDAAEAGDDDLSTPPVDTDGDGTPDYRDTDSDDDGVLDGEDVCRLVADPDQADLDGDGEGDACDGDQDGDGVPDEVDGCPRVAEAEQVDLDGDGANDPCDGDDDGDGVADEEDVCPRIADADQADLDGDGEGDACDDDGDGDGVPDEEDVCPRVADPDQSDLDGDGAGDACDDDDDGDGVPDEEDVCPRVADPDQADGDGDGVGDACDDDAATPPDESVSSGDGGCGCTSAGGWDLAGLLAVAALLGSRRRRG
jgi:uncharacterized delta-60 repeat protein